MINRGGLVSPETKEVKDLENVLLYSFSLITLMSSYHQTDVVTGLTSATLSCVAILSRTQTLINSQLAAGFSAPISPWVTDYAFQAFLCCTYLQRYTGGPAGSGSRHGGDRLEWEAGGYRLDSVPEFRAPRPGDEDKIELDRRIADGDVDSRDGRF